MKSAGAVAWPVFVCLHPAFLNTSEVFFVFFLYVKIKREKLPNLTVASVKRDYPTNSTVISYVVTQGNMQNL